jgi:hypothetical protein
MILNTTTKKIEVLLAAAPTTELSVTVDYVDFTSSDTVPGLALSLTNGTTPVDILASPASSTQRKVNGITICNRDVDFARVTVRLNDNSTTYDYTTISLPPGSTLQFTDTQGWLVIDAKGSIQVASGAYVDIQEFTDNGIWYRPESATYAHVILTGGGGAGGGGSSASGTNSAGGGGGGGGKRQIMTFLASDLTPSVSVTIGAETATTPLETDGQGGNISYFGNFLIAYAGGGGAWNSDTGAATGGAGGGGTANGASAGTSLAVNGGAAFTQPGTGASSATDMGAGSSSTNGPGSSFLGGAAGGVCLFSMGATHGGSSFQSAAGGGGGGGYNFSTTTDYAGGAGGSTGTATAAGGGATGGTAAGGNGANGANGDSTRCGQGGGGGGSFGAGQAGNGGDGGAPGGGGGGGGGGLTGGTGGKGARGGCIVMSW